MRRSHNACSVKVELRENGDRKRSTFGRIGSGTELIEKYQRTVIDLL